MATPMEYYKSLLPVAKTYATICLTIFYENVFKRFEIWKLITNFFFLGPFSLPFAFHLLIILRHGVSLERSPFDNRTRGYLWMFFFGALTLQGMAAVAFLWSPLMGASLVFMIVYVWSRELPNTRINSLVELKGFYLPWAMLALDLVFGNPLMPHLVGIGVGHLYYFLMVPHPLWIHKLVINRGMRYQMNSPIQRDPAN